MLNNKNNFAVVLLSLFLFQCTGDDPATQNPKRLLKEYINQSFSISSVDDRTTLEGYLTGDAKARLKAWSNQQFIRAFVKKKRKFLKLNYREVKTVGADKVNITYELTYMDKLENSQGGEVKITNKKVCFLVKENDKWLIQNVKNLKELIEYQDEMTLP